MQFVIMFLPSGGLSRSGLFEVHDDQSLLWNGLFVTIKVVGGEGCLG